jgi:hypothetical protein
VWLADYACELDNLRAALDWSFSGSGDGSIGIALTTAAVPLWMRLSLLDECRSRAKQALAALRADGNQDPRQEMRLHDALGTSATDAREMDAEFTKELEIAEQLADVEYQLRALHGLYFCRSSNGQYAAALLCAQRFCDITTNASDSNTLLLGKRMVWARLGISSTK